MSEQVETGPVTAMVAPSEDDAPREVVVPVASHPTATAWADRRRLAIVWGAALVGFGVFVGVASVEREAGRVEGDLRVARAWSLLADNLPDGTTVQIVVWGLFGLFVVAAGLGLWLALIAGTTTTESPSAVRSNLE